MRGHLALDPGRRTGRCLSRRVGWGMPPLPAAPPFFYTNMNTSPFHSDKTTGAPLLGFQFVRTGRCMSVPSGEGYRCII